MPELEALAPMLCCEDFSAELRSRRLMMVAGQTWCDDLMNLYAQMPGLPTPTQFIKTPLTPETQIEALIAQAQRCFHQINQQRQERLTQLRARDAVSEAAVDDGRRAELAARNALVQLQNQLRAQQTDRSRLQSAQELALAKLEEARQAGFDLVLSRGEFHARVDELFAG